METNKSENTVVEFNRFYPTKFIKEKGQYHYDSINRHYFNEVKKLLIKPGKFNRDIELLHLEVCSLGKDLKQFGNYGFCGTINIIHPYYDSLLRFNFQGQNNCCGAGTSSNTTSNYYQNIGLGTLMQFWKEDLAIASKFTKIYCTDQCDSNILDIYNLDNVNLRKLRHNSRLLFKTGWGIADSFLNRNSDHVVCMFSKNIPEHYKENTVVKILQDSDTKFTRIVEEKKVVLEQVNDKIEKETSLLF